MNKLMYKPVALAGGMVGGLLAGMVFKQVWKLAAGEKDAPDALDEHRSWAEILIAAGLQGAVFGVVKAAVDRAGAVGVRRVTGHWPGDD
jgi:predicted metal-dependent enzyme (double-stranded beta helix superfamily)